jgi:hypothetical protein
MHTHTHKSVDGREELESLSPADRKRGEEVDGGGARMTICFVSDIIVPPIFRWQSSTLACSKWIEKCITTHKNPFDFEYESWLSLDRMFLSSFSSAGIWEAQAEATGSLFNHC